MEENKKSKFGFIGLGVFVGVVLSVIVGLAGFIVYDKVLTKSDNERVESNSSVDVKNNENEVITDLSLDSTIVKSLRNIINSDSEEHLYKNNKVIFADEDITLKLTIAATYISNLFMTDEYGYDCSNGICGISYTSEDKIKNAYYEIFGKDSKYNRSNFYVYNNCGTYSWSEENNRYEAKMSFGCGGAWCGIPMIKPAYAKLITSFSENRIEIYDYFYYSECEGGYYSDYNKTNLITDSNISEEELFNNYTDKLGMYKYTFVDEGNGNYVFTSVERVK